jgi:hypothetical protein
LPEEIGRAFWNFDQYAKNASPENQRESSAMLREFLDPLHIELHQQVFGPSCFAVERNERRQSCKQQDACTMLAREI